MRRKTLLKIIAILVQMSMLGISTSQPELDDELDRLLGGGLRSDGSLFFKAAETKVIELEPHIGRAIILIRSSPASNKKHSCLDWEIQRMTVIHNFMLSYSEKYRNADENSKVIRSLINSHWNYMIKCLEKETEYLSDKMKSDRWRSLARMVRKFWRITSIKGDMHFLEIASDLDAGRRKLRSAKENPKDWSRLISGLLIEEQKFYSQPPQKITRDNIYTILEKAVIVDDVTKMKYPDEIYLRNLYDRLILERCREYQEDQALLNSLKKALKLAGVTHWPRVWKESEKIFAPKFDGPILEHLTLGLVVCKHLDQNFMNEAIENGLAIVEELEDRSPSDSGEFDETELENILARRKDFRLSKAAEHIELDILEPEIAYVIDFAKSSFNLENRGVPCQEKEIEEVKKIHNYMLNHSERYRKKKTDYYSVRAIIKFNWRFVMRCLNEEAENLPQKFRSYETRLETKFRKITSIVGDLFYLNIASDIVAGRRKIRDARESPREWAEIFEESLRRISIYDDDYDHDENDQNLQPEIEIDVYDSFLRATEVNSITGVRYPKEGSINMLYDLVLEQCKTLQADHMLVTFLEKARRLSEVTQWPKTYDLGGKMFRADFPKVDDETLLGPLTLRLVVCNRLNDHFRQEAINNGVAIVTESLKQRGTSGLDDDQLEDLMGTALSKQGYMSYRSKRISTSYLEPNLAYIIEKMQISPIFFAPFRFKCTREEIQLMNHIHNFMMQESTKYRNDDIKFIVIRTFIDGHWKYMITCFDLETRNMKEKLRDDKWQFLSNMLLEFWQITSVHRDIYFLDIVSDLSAGRRIVRDPSESPRDWANMIKGLLLREAIQSFVHVGRGQQRIIQGLAVKEVEESLKKEVYVDAVTGVRYPRKGYMGELYDRLILGRCRLFLDDQEQNIVKSLRKVAFLSGVTKWPKKGRNRRNSYHKRCAEFDESIIGPLTLGLFVCNELSDRHRELAVSNEIEIFDALTEGIAESDWTDTASLLSACELFRVICEQSQSLVSILQTARSYIKDQGLKMFQEQMARLEPVAKRAPDSFSCQNAEVEIITAVSKSISRLLLVSTDEALNCLTNFYKLVAELKEQLVNTCFRSVIKSLETVTEEATKIQVLRMPRFWRIIGQSSVPSLKDCLKYAGHLYNGSMKIFDVRQNEQEWEDFLRLTGRDIFRDPPYYMPDGLKGYWKRGQEQSFNHMDISNRKYKDVKLSQQTIYDELIIGWCENFEPRETHLRSRYVKKIERIVKFASLLVRLELWDEYFFNLGINSEDEFLLRQSALGYSVCNFLDPYINLYSFLHIGSIKEH